MKKNITVLIYDHCWAMSVFSVTGFFRIANLLSLHIENTESYHVSLVSTNGQPAESACGIELSPNENIENTTTSDLVVIPPIEGARITQKSVEKKDEVLWLKKQIKNNIPILSLTTGVDLLAATGLFKNDLLATHWAFIPQLKRKYPADKFIAYESYLCNESVYSTGTLNGTFDALLAFVAQDKGDKFAQLCAAHLLVSHPSKVTPMLFNYRNHTDKAILLIQDWLETHFKQEINLAELACKFGLSERNFKRRFTQATKIPPNKYLQEVRIDMAKKLLISTELTVKAVAYNVGYENDSFFNRIFKKKTGMTLAKWRSSVSVGLT